MANPENVIGKGTPFKKGQSGNPKGRPKLPNLARALEKVLAEKNIDGETALLEVLRALKKQAMKGDPRAIELLLDRGYGKLTQQVDWSAHLRTVGDAFPDEIKQMFPYPDEIKPLDNGQDSQPEPNTPLQLPE